ncbi:germination protein YpeB [Bacillota bacterium LX-D]|nr:germination protein YpeB [Bacillota bacterium LX-D]
MRKLLYIGLLTLFVIGLFAWGNWERAGKQRLSYALEAGYQNNFYNLVSHVEQSRILLGKSLISGSPKHNILYLTEIWNRAADAQNSLAALPITEVNMASTRKFLNQLGDYCFTLARAEANGRQLSNKDYEKLKYFYDETGRLSENLHEIETNFNQDGFRWTDAAVNTDWLKSAQAAPKKDLANFVDIEKRIQGLPTLIYDGPFSDHLELKKPLGLSGKNLVSSEAAAEAQKFLSFSKEQNYRIIRTSQVNGKIPAFNFILNPNQSKGLISVDVSKKGGHIITVLNNRTIGSKKISLEEAEDKANQFLKENGYQYMLPTYRITQDNSLVITYVYCQDNVVIYPDQLKVKVALDNGEIVGFESFSYLMAHHARKIPKAKLTERDVKARINPNVVVESMRQAIIPLENGKEVFTYEVKGVLRQEQYLIYINALNGDEENILKVMQQPGGNLVL